MPPKKGTATKLKLPEGQEQIPKDIQTTVASILQKYSEKGKKYRTKGIDFAPISILAGISNLYLNKKYKTNCYMYGSKVKEFIHGGFKIVFLTEQIPSITGEFLANFIRENKNQITIFLNCIKNNNPVIIIPLGLIFPGGGHHANMLIYKRALNTIEHFEPHGSSFETNPDYGDKIKTILEALVTEINTVKTKPLYSIQGLGDITFVPSDQVCPRSRGLQAIQEELKKSSIEQGEYCQMWSFLFAELALLNPTMTSRDIMDEIFTMIQTTDGAQELTDVIRGYVSILGEEISTYLSEYINNAFTIENISYIFLINRNYANYLAKMLEDIIFFEVNAEMLVSQQQPKPTIPQLEANETTLKNQLLNYFIAQQQVKELVIHRLCNYTSQDINRVNAEINNKLELELNEYRQNSGYIDRYIKNKVLKNFLITKQSSEAKPRPKTVKKGGKKYKKRKLSKTKKNRRSRKHKR